MTPNDSRTPGGQRDTRGIVRRFGYYFVGIGIGFVLLGLFHQARGPRVPPGAPAAAPASNTPAPEAEPAVAGDADDRDGE